MVFFTLITAYALGCPNELTEDAEMTFSGSAFQIFTAATWKGSATDS